MSALTIRVAAKAKIIKQVRCVVPGCTRGPSRIVEIAGWPAGRLCPKHAAEWRHTWDEALVPADDREAA